MPRDPYTGVDIPSGEQIAKCPRGHISMIDSWKEGNKCHYPGCGYTGAPTSVGVNTDMSIRIGARQREASGAQSSPIALPPSNSSITPANDGFDIRVVHQQRIVRLDSLASSTPQPSGGAGRPGRPGWGAAFVQSLLITGVIAVIASFILAAALTTDGAAIAAIVIVWVIALLVSVIIALARTGGLR